MKIPHFVINNKDVAYRHQLVERGYSRIAVAHHSGFGAILVDAALTGVDAGVATGPEIPGHSVPVVPPGIRDTTQFKRRVVAIVLQK